ncbi:hypothetical protein [Candidatus Enterococcus mansonii]|uniref:Uncharacterized protein n=1 Tax=Candidatus Enterococcus mansonii TaxID=1834181 RepID=A0A242CDW9_9ENTE|nr:hypothetical protein [Enterococcus sp. 4G2_DIV0659]OTO08437.1 hypothetical protein A5880_001437 [Enterococcus sp. 4G2_DIV0659]
MNETILFLVMVYVVMALVKRVKEKGKKRYLFFAVASFSFIILLGNFLENHNAIMQGSIYSMVITFILSFVILTVLLSAPLIFGLRKIK